MPGMSDLLVPCYPRTGESRRAYCLLLSRIRMTVSAGAIFSLPAALGRLALSLASVGGYLGSVASREEVWRRCAVVTESSVLG